MILRWGRRGLIAGALAVSFVTPVSTTSINEVQHRPSVKFEFRHVTPSGAAPPTTSIKRVQYRPDIRFEFRHVTPVVVEPPAAGSIHRYQVLPDHKLVVRHITPAAAPPTGGGTSAKQPHGAYIKYPGEQKQHKIDRRKLAALAILAIQEYYGD